MLEPWAEISERLRRIHQNFKLAQYPLIIEVIELAAAME
jgi:hypothetical protein